MKRKYSKWVVAARKKIGAERCECVVYVHMSKASTELKVVLLHLWRVNVKWRIFFTFHLRIFTWIKLHHNNITNFVIIVDRPRKGIFLSFFKVNVLQIGLQGYS
jgi:hypothetical protein